AMMIAFNAGDANALYVAGFFVGTVLYPVYSLNVAHANDLAEPDEYVTLSSAIMILYGMGTVTGPLMAGSLMQWLGPNALIVFLGTAFALYAGYAAWRITRRPDSGSLADKADFQAAVLPMQGTEGASPLADPER
ncbi:MAG: MFS transporter, partial [Allorhizobium sp.]